MASIKRDTTITECQNFAREVYGLNNDRYFNIEDMLTQIQRFAMRGLKGIRKNSQEKIKTNLLVSFSWFMSLMNQLKETSKLVLIFSWLFFLMPFSPLMAKR